MLDQVVPPYASTENVGVEIETSQHEPVQVSDEVRPKFRPNRDYDCQDARVAEADNTWRERRPGIESADIGRQRKNPWP